MAPTFHYSSCPSFCLRRTGLTGEGIINFCICECRYIVVVRVTVSVSVSVTVTVSVMLAYSQSLNA